MDDNTLTQVIIIQLLKTLDMLRYFVDHFQWCHMVKNGVSKSSESRDLENISNISTVFADGMGFEWYATHEIIIFATSLWCDTMLAMASVSFINFHCQKPFCYDLFDENTVYQHW